MKRHFFILALPRSRTAWLSAFLTVPGLSHCHHEALNGPVNWKEFEDILNRPEPIIGNSDSGNILAYRGLKARYPDAVFIKVVRPLDEVNASLRNIYQEGDANLLNEYLSGIDEPQFDFHNLDTARIWEMCIGIPVDQKRVDSFESCNIQCDLNKQCCIDSMEWLLTGVEKRGLTERRWMRPRRMTNL